MINFVKKLVKNKLIKAVCLMSIANIAHAAAIHEGFVQIVDAHTIMPGQQRAFNSFIAPSLSAGHIVFLGFGRLFEFGVYTNFANSLQLVADNRSHSPSSHELIRSFQSDNILANIPLIDKNNILLYFKTENIVGIYRDTYHDLDQKIQPVVDSHTKMKSSQKHFDDFAWPQWTQNQSIIFLGSHDHQQEVDSVTPDGVLHLQLAVNSKNVPHGKGHFAAIKQLATVSNLPSDQFAFIADSRAKHQSGVYLKQKNQLSRIVDMNTKIPDGLGFFSHFDALSYDGKNIAWIGGGIVGQQGIYYSDAKGINKAVDLQTPVPSSEDTFLEFRQVIVRHGWIIFSASTHDGEQGIYLYSLQSGLFKLLSTQDELNKQAIKQLDISPYALDGKNLALVVSFTNGQQAIFVSTINLADY